MDREEKTTITSLTERIRDLEEKLKQAQARNNEFEEILRRIPDVVFILDEDGRISYINEAVRSYGCAPAYLIGKKVIDIIHPEDLGRVQHKIQERRTGKRATNDLETRLFTQFMGERVFETRTDDDIERSFVVSAEGRYGIEVPKVKSPYTKQYFQGTYCVARDITEKKRLNRDIEWLNKRYKTIMKTAAEVIYITDSKGTIIDWNDSAENIFGYTEKEISGMNILQLFPDKVKEEYGLKASDIGNIVPQYLGQVIDVDLLSKKGESIPSEFTLTLWVEGNEILYAISVRDIRDRKRSEDALREREARYKNIFENSLVSIWEEDISAVRAEIDKLKNEGISDFNSYFDLHPEKVKELASMVRVIDVNDTTLKWYGAETKGQFIGSIDKFFADESYKLFKKELFALTTGERVVEGETQGKTVDGSILDLLLRITIPTPDEPHTNMLVAVTDITAVKKLANDLRVSLKEKNILMKELNHRVKNNLALIASLINLRESTPGNETDLSDIRHQIDAIRIIHEKLYRSEDVSHINIKEYIPDLLSTIFSFSNKPVDVEVTIDEVSMPTNTAIPIGLIINEIATNAMKHGFTSEDVRFSLSFEAKSDDERYIMTISNTGNPFLGAINFQKPETLGLRLVSGLVSQIDGTIELDPKPHPTFTITFPISP